MAFKVGDKVRTVINRGDGLMCPVPTKSRFATEGVVAEIANLGNVGGCDQLERQICFVKTETLGSMWFLGVDLEAVVEWPAVPARVDVEIKTDLPRGTHCAVKVTGTDGASDRAKMVLW